MSDKKPSTSASDGNALSKIKSSLQKVEAKIKAYYIKAIKLIHARHFMAEFLATFILVVSNVVQLKVLMITAVS